MRNGDRSLTVILALCTGCFISSLIYYNVSSLVHQASFSSGLLLNLGHEGNTSSIKTKSDERNNKTSILCVVMTTPERYLSALAVKNTWGKRCDKLIFFGDKLDEKLESVKLSGVREGRKFLWGKTREALKYLYDYYLNDFDWFYKVDDDTYVIMENLRYVLTPYDPEFPIGLGERALVDGNKAKSYLIGGASYVLSRGTLRIYGNVTYHNNSLCPANHQGDEDVTLGRCLNRSGILLGDTRDELGRHRFHQMPPVIYIKGILEKWYQNSIIYTYGKGIDSLSETAVTFHGMKDKSHLYIFEFFIYRLQLFGVSGRFKGPQIAPLPPDINAIPVQVLKRFQRATANESRSKIEERSSGSPPS